MKMEAKHQSVMFIPIWRTASLHIVQGSNIHTRNIDNVTSDAGPCVYAQPYCVGESADRVAGPVAVSCRETHYCNLPR
jgi:hypothetical protein